MDSDGDGRTNGEELGDVSCEWKRHDDDVPVYHGKRFTHPGVTNSKWPEERSDDDYNLLFRAERAGCVCVEKCQRARSGGERLLHDTRAVSLVIL